MAKKRRQKIEKKEDYIFKFPELDRSEFIKNELRTAKATVLGFGFAIVMALVSFGFLMALGDFRVGAIIGIFGIAGLPFIFNMMKMDMTEFEKKSWLGVGAVYFFTWLMVSFLLVNPPLTDIAEPEIENITFEIFDESVVNASWEKIDNINSDGEMLVPQNQSVRISAEIWDNAKLKSETISCQIISANNEISSTLKSKIGDRKYAFEFSFSNETSVLGVYEYVITADDKKGNSAEERGIFHVIAEQ